MMMMTKLLNYSTCLCSKLLPTLTQVHSLTADFNTVAVQTNALVHFLSLAFFDLLRFINETIGARN